jgi:myo-inositol-1(or 4)-monophosphatase
VTVSDRHTSDDPFQAREALALAEHAAREGGRFLVAMPRRAAAPVSETDRDIKLRADRGAEDRIVDVLAGSRIPIVAEERSADAPAHAGGLRWIVDPLDGTMNYFQGIPFCCVSVALWKDDEPVAAAIYDFDRDDMFSAVVGAGAWLNGSMIHVQPAVPDRAVLCTGFPAATDFATPVLSRFVEQIQRFRKIRLLGSAALSLAYVAAGRAHAYFERDVRIWDVAAGLTLVRAAGGQFVRTQSSVPYALTVYAHNGSCPWPELTFA